jgi:O-antigen/teichoic acid export membrane protein
MTKNSINRELNGPSYQKSLKQILVRGASASFILRIAGTGIAFAAQIILTRLMGAEHYGNYIYVLTWINILVLFGKMGWDIVLLRYVAVYNVHEEWGKLKGILQSSSRITLIKSFIVSFWFYRVCYANVSEITKF